MPDVFVGAGCETSAVATAGTGDSAIADPPDRVMRYELEERRDVRVSALASRTERKPEL
jgi:hypothetical protein